jgi:uncharacterized membrane protein
MSNLHPVFVHFPFALLLVALLLEIAAIFFKRDEFSGAAWWNQILGTIGLACAVASGLLAAQNVQMDAPARALFDTHQQIAFLSAASFAGLLFWRLSAKGKIPGHQRHLFLVLFAAAVLLMAAGAWLGGELVYRHAVGVR